MPLEQCQSGPPTPTLQDPVQGLTTPLVHKCLPMPSLNLRSLVKFSFGLFLTTGLQKFTEPFLWDCLPSVLLLFSNHATCLYFFFFLDNRCCNSFTTTATRTGLEISCRHRLPTFPAHPGGGMVPQQSPRQGTCPFMLVPAQPSSVAAPPQCLHWPPVPSKPDEHRMRKQPNLPPTHTKPLQVKYKTDRPFFVFIKYLSRIPTSHLVCLFILQN